MSAWLQVGDLPPQGIIDPPEQLTDDQLLRKVAHLEAEVARLRAGENHTPRENGTWPTPGQFIAQFNAAGVGERFAMAGKAITDAQLASECFVHDHKGELAYLRAREVGR